MTEKPKVEGWEDHIKRSRGLTSIQRHPNHRPMSEERGSLFWNRETLEKKREEAKRNRPPIPPKREFTQEEKDMEILRSFIAVGSSDKKKVMQKLQELPIDRLRTIQAILLKGKPAFNYQPLWTDEKYALALNVVNALVQQKTEPEKETIGSKIAKYLHL